MLSRCNPRMKDAGEEQRVAQHPLLLAVVLYHQLPLHVGAAQEQPPKTCGQEREGKLSGNPL